MELVWNLEWNGNQRRSKRPGLGKINLLCNWMNIGKNWEESWNLKWFSYLLKKRVLQIIKEKKSDNLSEIRSKPENFARRTEKKINRYYTNQRNSRRINMKTLLCRMSMYQLTEIRNTKWFQRKLLDQGSKLTEYYWRSSKFTKVKKQFL